MYLFNTKLTTTDMKQLIIDNVQSLSTKNNSTKNNSTKNNLLALFKSELLIQKDVNINDILNEVSKDKYSGSIIDLLFLSQIFKINIIVLHSRITKLNPRAVNVFTNKESNKYLIIYSYKEKAITRKSYSLIRISPMKLIIYNKENIPKEVYNYIYNIKKSSKSNSYKSNSYKSNSYKSNSSKSNSSKSNSSKSNSSNK